MALTCYRCGSDGHIAAECNLGEITDSRPVWCGQCDQRTRQIWLNRDGTLVQRCPNCHPAPNKPLPQHRRCPNCKVIAYAWDTNQCGEHEGPQMPDRRLEIEQIHEIERANDGKVPSQLAR